MNSLRQYIKNNLLSIVIGIVYLWFGLLKFFPGISPAEEIAKNTVFKLTLSLIPSDICILLLAALETGLGILLILNLYRKISLRICLGHIILTFSPLLLFPEQIFNSNLFQLTMLGQYIMKNIIISGVLIVLLSENRKSKLQSI